MSFWLSIGHPWSIMRLELVAANVFSGLAALFLILSTLSESREKIYFYQLFECVLLIVAQILFREPSAAVVLALSALRNFLLWRKSYDFTAAFIIFITILVTAIPLSEGSAVSLLPMAATLIYTVTTYKAKSFVYIKVSLFINLLIWIVYSFMIFDVSTFLINIVSLILNSVSLFNYIRRREV